MAPFRLFDPDAAIPFSTSLCLEANVRIPRIPV
jgi:hypothetical protein